ncbi:restriction endonuclease subunit S [Brachyspira intermedia]|uniref:restriction endonuclease subunit S n=1 Tax=Brachyspira intermedia TaxID=84377 RepID=UPI003005955A
MKELKEEWQEVRLGDVVDFNPTEKLIKGNNYKKVPMDCLIPKTRKIENYEVNTFNGGSKFRNGDTLMARITPCLENGKTAQVSILEENEIAFGSTEFIVLREKENISDNNFIYYLFNTDYIRSTAIKSMTGTSGRQRVQEDVLKNIIIKLPPLEEQKKIASILSSLDDKIELNNSMNKILEETAQTIFKEWFINFNFPNEEGKPYKKNGGNMIESELGEIPEGWEVTNLDNLLSKFTTGLNPRQNFKLGEGNNYYVTIKNMNDNQIYLDNRCDKINDDAIIKINKRSDLRKNDLLFSGIGTIGRVYLINKDVTNWNISESIFTMRVNDIITPEYLYLNLLDNRMQEYALNLASGSVQKGIRMGDLKKYKMIIPKKEILILSTKIFSAIIEKVNNNFDENQKLAGIRDSILPKLMSGEIRIK